MRGVVQVFECSMDLRARPQQAEGITVRGSNTDALRQAATEELRTLYPDGRIVVNFAVSRTIEKGSLQLVAYVRPPADTTSIGVFPKRNRAGA